MASKRTKTDAEARYAKAQKRAQEVSKVYSEVEAEAKRVDENTARLRALRLAKEAADLKAKEAAAPKKKKAAPKKATAPKTAARKTAAAPKKPATTAAKAKPRAKAIPVEKLSAANDK